MAAPIEIGKKIAFMVDQHSFQGAAVTTERKFPARPVRKLSLVCEKLSDGFSFRFNRIVHLEIEISIDPVRNVALRAAYQHLALIDTNRQPIKGLSLARTG